MFTLTRWDRTTEQQTSYARRWSYETGLPASGMIPKTLTYRHKISAKALERRWSNVVFDCTYTHYRRMCRMVTAMTRSRSLAIGLVFDPPVRHRSDDGTELLITVDGASSPDLAGQSDTCRCRRRTPVAEHPEAVSIDHRSPPRLPAQPQTW